MKAIVKYGLWIGALCVIWTFVMGFTGWYKHPTLLNLFWLVVVIEIAFLVVGLRETAAVGNRYWQQVAAGTGMAAVAAVIIFCGSFLFTSVVFPEYFGEIQTLQAEMMRTAGSSEAEISTAMDLAKTMQTPLINAISGAIGTLATGLVASLVIAAFCRQK